MEDINSPVFAQAKIEYTKQLIDVLKFTYDRMNVNSGIIDIYVSACLYIRPEQLEDIKGNYREWYNCNFENIKEGYEKELDDINKNRNM